MCNSYQLIALDETTTQEAEAPDGVGSRLYELIRGKVKNIVDVCYEITLESHLYLAATNTDGLYGDVAIPASQKVYLSGSTQDGTVVPQWRRPDSDAFALLDWVNTNGDGFATTELATIKKDGYSYNSLTLTH